MTRDDAERLNVVFLQIVSRRDETAAFVQEKGDKAEWHLYRKAVGSAMAGVFELAEGLWARFPDLKPEQLGGTYQVDLLIYEPRFY
ncbi:hypothetical protein KK141_10025 [Dyella sp. LX-66]|uniref:hypothetical protein n=1 Tax=unclassified Dyella TaxID=2634549 RepID=UPI001BDF836F|nr:MULTISPECIES: hypothetical protein [unclassified Dyella]MBT2117055.1 hypothetical protein [Dyella sp. LX-1]MBT2139869.1 hypothetical protein [Dyella sp. LX-66]